MKLHQSTAAENNRSVDELFDALDRARRTRPIWIQRDIVITAIARRGGSVPVDIFGEIVVGTAGYSSVSAVNPFFRGEPQQILERQGKIVRSSARGHSGAAFFNRYRLPWLRDGKMRWPTNEAERLFS